MESPEGRGKTEARDGEGQVETLWPVMAAQGDAPTRSPRFAVT